MSARRRVWLTPSADPARDIPRSTDERQWEIQAALASLQDEQRRLEQLGFELPLSRCHEQRRFWEFVRAIDSLGSSQDRIGRAA